MQQANSTQSWDIEGLIQSMTAVLTPGQVSLIADLADTLSKSKSVSDTPSSTESDQFEDVNYCSMSSPIQNDDMDDLIYNQHDSNKINSTSMRNKSGLNNLQKESMSSQDQFKPYYNNSSKNNLHENFYNLDLDREPAPFSEFATRSSRDYPFVKSIDSPPNITYHYKS